MSRALRLQCHPQTPCPEVADITVELGQPGSGRLQIGYRLAGDMQALRIAPPDARVRAEQLWRHTCCELFLATPGTDAYSEFNFSPSGSWAAYRFPAYRSARQNLPLTGAPVIECVSGAAELLLTARLPMDELGLVAGQALRIGVSAVVETRAGTLSYWALRHPPGLADFHHAAGHMELTL